MSDEAAAEGGPPGRGADGTLSISEQQLELDIARLVFIVIAGACAVALVELLRWLFKGVGGKVGARHPLMMELVGVLVDRPWRSH